MAEAEQFLKYGEVAKRYRMHYTTMYDHIKKGNFPAPLKIGKVARWRLSDLEAWEKSQLKEEVVR